MFFQKIQESETRFLWNNIRILNIVTFQNYG